MAKSNNQIPISQAKRDAAYKAGQLDLIDHISAGDEDVAHVLKTFTDHINTNRRSRMWQRALINVENLLFSAGRHYLDDLLVSRLAANTEGNQSVIEAASRTIPRPVNDLLGRYVETNIALLTENRPRPRITPKSDRAEDVDNAKLSELTVEYMWEALRMPEKHRELARMILHTGIAWLELVYDPLQPRRIAVPETTREESSLVNVPGGPVSVPVPREVPVRDEEGRLKYTQDVQYGDITAKIISPFEMHVPSVHNWNGNEMGWIMREYYAPKQSLIDKFKDKRKMGLTKSQGWYLENLDDLEGENVKDLPMWWWERLTDLVEGPGPSIYVGTPEMWENYVVVRVFDRRPTALWPKGRTVIAAGDKVLYDSPKNVGARAYDPRWPDRWHPYIRFINEPQSGSIYGRSLVSKLLPKLKRINSIDTTLIMWRRTVPIASWILPKGAAPVEDQWSGFPGHVFSYDPRLTAGAKPEPIYPPEYPKTALEERQMQLAEMEFIAGTEEILRGQRPAGATSGSMISILRRQALASRSSTLQAWDEALQDEGSAILQEVIKHIRKDPRYAAGIRIIARDQQSQLSIEQFSGTNLSDNVNIKIDTASMALASKEAREQKMLEFMQYLPNLMSVPTNIRTAIFNELGLTEQVEPQGPDVQRAKRMMAWIRQGDFNRVIPYPEDDPYVFYEIFVKEMKSDAFFNLDRDQQTLLLALIDKYRQQIEQIEMQQMQMMMMQQGQGGQ